MCYLAEFNFFLRQRIQAYKMRLTPKTEERWGSYPLGVGMADPQEIRPSL